MLALYQIRKICNFYSNFRIIYQVFPDYVLEKKKFKEDEIARLYLPHFGEAKLVKILEVMEFKYKVKLVSEDATEYYCHEMNLFPITDFKINNNIEYIMSNQKKQGYITSLPKDGGEFYDIVDSSSGEAVNGLKYEEILTKNPELFLIPVYNRKYFPVKGVN